MICQTGALAAGRRHRCFILGHSMHNIRAIFCLATVLALTFSVTACDSGEQGNAMHNPVVEAKVGKLFAAIKAEKYEQVLAQYHQSFFNIRAPEAWVDELKAHLAERGPLQAYHLRRSQADTRFSGKFFILEYETVHTGNKRLHHLLTLVLPVEGGEIRLLGHKITPWEVAG